MKRTITLFPVFVVLVALLLLAGAAMGQVVDTLVPGAFQFAATGDTPGPFDVTISVVVQDKVGTTGTQASFTVSGGVLTSSGSGRDAGVTWVDRILETNSVVLTASDGTQPTTFTPTVKTQTYGRHRSWTVWTSTGAIPDGVYSMEITGSLSCISYRGVLSACTPPKESVVSTTTFTNLPATYWWSDISSPSGSTVDLLSALTNEAAQIPHLYGVYKTFPGDNSGPQQVCDQYNSVIGADVMIFWSFFGVNFQLDGVTATVTNNVCDYTIAYEDPNNPGVVITEDQGSGIVVAVDSGSDPTQAPQPPID